MRVIPSRGEVFEVAPRRFHRADFWNLLRGVPWQDGLMTIDPVVTEPGLGSRHAAHRNIGGLAPGKFAHRIRQSFSPGQRVSCRFALAGQIQKGGQGGPRFDRRRRDHLRNHQ